MNVELSFYFKLGKELEMSVDSISEEEYLEKTQMDEEMIYQ